MDDSAGASGTGTPSAPGPRDAAPDRQDGHTLIELLICLAISAISLALAFGGYSSLSAVLATQRRITACQLALNEAFLEIERDVRNAGTDPRGVGLFGGGFEAAQVVPSAASSTASLVLRADLTGPSSLPDGDLDDVAEVVVYALEPATGFLYRRISNGAGGVIGTAVLDEVLEFTPELLDRAGQPTVASPVQVRLEVVRRVSATSPQQNAPTRRQVYTLVLPNGLIARD